jgi:hypothetical protein
MNSAHRETTQKIQADVEAYLAAGGKITVLPGFEPKPFIERATATPAPKTPVQVAKIEYGERMTLHYFHNRIKRIQKSIKGLPPVIADMTFTDLRKRWGMSYGPMTMLYRNQPNLCLLPEPHVGTTPARGGNIQLTWSAEQINAAEQRVMRTKV